MSNRFAVYEASKVTLVVAAIPILDGRTKDGFVKVTWDGDQYGDETSADGLVTRYRTNERVVTVEVTVDQASNENEKMSALHAADVISENGSGVGAFFLKDNNGATIVAGAQCWISKPADIELGETPVPRVWKFRVVLTPVTAIVGGN